MNVWLAQVLLRSNGTHYNNVVGVFKSRSMATKCALEAARDMAGEFFRTSLHKSDFKPGVSLESGHELIYEGERFGVLVSIRNVEVK